MRFARWCLLLAWLSAVVLLLALLAVVGMYAPHLIAIVAAVALWLRRKRSRVSSNYGSASWANSDHKSLLGLLNTVGIPLGTIPRLKIREAVWHLWKCKDRLAGVRTLLRALDKRVNFVASNECVHACGFAGSGKGKTTALIFPLAFTDPSACVFLDPKGEIYKTVSAYRKKRFGRRQVVLDPWRCVTQRPDRLNVMDLLCEADPNALDEARALAEGVVIRKGESHADPHWDDSAEMNIAGIIGLLVTMEGAKSLQVVAQVLADATARENAVKVMLASKAWGGLLARAGYQMSNAGEKELAGILSTIGRHLRFLGVPAVVESTSSSTFDPRDLCKGEMDVYLVVPPEHLTTQSALLRLWVTCLLRAITKGGLTDKPVRFVLDEAAALGGHLPVLENAVSQLRSYGLRIFAMYQSMGQLETCFPKGQAQTFLSNMDVRIFFGVNDYATAEYVSKALGDETVLNQSGSTGSSMSKNLDAFTPDAKQVSWNTGSSWQEGARNLLQPPEVMKLPAQQAVVFVNGKTLMTTLTPHYSREFKRWKWQQSRFYQRWIVVRSVLAGLLMTVCVATILVVLYHAVLVPTPQTQGRSR